MLKYFVLFVDKIGTYMDENIENTENETFLDQGVEKAFKKGSKRINNLDVIASQFSKPLNSSFRISDSVRKAMDSNPMLNGSMKSLTSPMDGIMKSLRHTEALNGSLARQLSILNEPIHSARKLMENNNRFNNVLSGMLPHQKIRIEPVRHELPKIDTSWLQEEAKRKANQAVAAEATIEMLEVQRENCEAIKLMANNQAEQAALIGKQNKVLENMLRSQEESDRASIKRDRRNFLLNILIAVLTSAAVCIGIMQFYLAVQQGRDSKLIDAINGLKDIKL